MIRTFIAAQLAAPPALQQVLQDLRELGSAIRPVSAANLHVTLKFLGDTVEQLVPQIGQVVARTASAHSRCQVLLKGLGAFPRPERPNVIWVGLTFAETLIEMAQELDAGLEPLGIARDARPFTPHLTLARIKSRPPRELATYLQKHADTSYGESEIGRIEFLKSELLAEGAKYTSLTTAEMRPVL